MLGTGLVAAAVLPGCSGGNTGGSQPDVTVTDLQKPAYFYEGDHLGEVVTVSAPVADVRNDTVFELSGNPSSVRITVVSLQPVQVQRDEVMQVTGTVGQLHSSAPSDRVPYLQESLYSKADTESFIYDAVVRPTPG